MGSPILTQAGTGRTIGLSYIQNGVEVACGTALGQEEFILLTPGDAAAAPIGLLGFAHPKEKRGNSTHGSDRGITPINTDEFR